MKNNEVEQEHIEMQDRWNKEFGVGWNPEYYKMKAIGYLDITEEFEKGVVTTKFIDKLKILWNEGLTLASMGHHTCEFCFNDTSSSEKTLIDKENNIKYFFPEMIFHYIEVHKFKPSDKFIELVMKL